MTRASLDGPDCGRCGHGIYSHADDVGCRVYVVDHFEIKPTDRCPCEAWSPAGAASTEATAFADQSLRWAAEAADVLDASTGAASTEATPPPVHAIGPGYCKTCEPGFGHNNPDYGAACPDPSVHGRASTEATPPLDEIRRRHSFADGRLQDWDTCPDDDHSADLHALLARASTEATPPWETFTAEDGEVGIRRASTEATERPDHEMLSLLLRWRNGALEGDAVLLADLTDETTDLLAALTGATSPSEPNHDT
jgi:hypothetical protein